MMKTRFVIIALIFWGSYVQAQEFEVPKNYLFSSNEDFAKYEPDVLKGINWICSTPLDSQRDKRKEVNVFLISWMSGSPRLSIDVKPEIVNFMSQNPDLLIIFMAGWTKYCLETKDCENRAQGNLKGIEAVIDFYQKNKSLMKTDKNVEQYILLKEQGKLADYISKKA